MSWKVALVIVVFVLLIVAAMIFIYTFFAAKSLVEVFKPDPNKAFFFHDVQIRQKDRFALVVDHKEKGFFLVEDSEKVLAYKDQLKIKGSFINFLPGEGKRNYGLWLYANNQLVKRKTGGVFKEFEVGDLDRYGVGVERFEFSGNAKEILTKRKELSKNPNSFFPKDLPNNFSERLDFKFNIEFPIIITTQNHNKKEVCLAIETELSGLKINPEDYSMDCRFTEMNEKLFLRAKSGSAIELVNRTGDEAQFFSQYYVYKLGLYIRGTKSACETIRGFNFEQVKGLSTVSFPDFMAAIEKFSVSADIDSSQLPGRKFELADIEFTNTEMSEINEFSYSFEYHQKK